MALMFDEHAETAALAVKLRNQLRRYSGSAVHQRMREMIAAARVAADALDKFVEAESALDSGK